MESFFVVLEIDNRIKDGVKTVTDFLNKSNYHIAINKDRRLILDNSLLIEISCNDKIRLSIEGCLAWFKENLHLIYSVYNNLRNSYDVQIHHPSGMKYSDIEETAFILEISNIYKNKLKQFMINFNNIHLKVLPGKDFYMTWENIHKVH